jgi:hypothetical protein
MAWRDTLLRWLGPGLLGGITLGDWIRVLRDNRFDVSPSSSLRLLYESWRYGSRLQDVAIPPPVFILGHWRGGTTHLHNLLTIDERFAFANNYQALYPHIFLSTEAMSARWIEFLMPRRRPMDNVEWNMRSPQEDEFALCILTAKSPCMGWIFPRRRDHYDRYLTLRSVSRREVTQWQEAFTLFLRKLTWKYDRTLVLKSPPHTGRIRLLLQMFPQARFVHIHRNPFDVFQSSRKTFQVNGELQRVQSARQGDMDAWVLRQYREMYDAFFSERGLIPEGHFHEVGFEELERDPIGQVQRIYEALSLPEFGPAEPALRRYVDSIAGYRRNEFPELPADLRARIAAEWRPCFEAWGYSIRE